MGNLSGIVRNIFLISITVGAIVLLFVVGTVVLGAILLVVVVLMVYYKVKRFILNRNIRKSRTHEQAGSRIIDVDYEIIDEDK